MAMFRQLSIATAISLLHTTAEMAALFRDDPRTSVQSRGAGTRARRKWKRARRKRKK